MTEYENDFMSQAASYPKQHCFVWGSQTSPACPSKRWRWVWGLV